MSKELYNKWYSDFVGKKDWIYNKSELIKIIECGLQPIRPDDKMLDIGCNKGDFVKYFQQFAPQTFGIDVNKEAIKEKVTYNVFCQSGDNILFDDGFFDKIYISGVLEHIERDGLVIKEIDRVLKPNGKLLIIYPCELFKGMCCLRAALIGNIYPWKIHLHWYFPKDIKRMVKETKLKYLYSKFAFTGIVPQWLSVLKKSDE